MKHFLSILFALSFLVNTQIGAQTSHNIVLKVRKSSAASTVVKFSFRMLSSEDKLTVDWGDGRHPVVYPSAPSGLTPVSYTYTTPPEGDIAVTLNAESLLTLRILSSSTIVGATEIDAPNLQTLNIDYTTLSAYPAMNLSKCLQLQTLTLNGADLETITLPATTTLTDVQIASGLTLPKKISTLDVSQNPNLLVLSASGQKLTTLDLSNNRKLSTLRLSSNLLTEVKGLKTLKTLTELDIKNNKLSYDQLPDLNETTLDKFLYSPQKNYPVPTSQINENTVDLSHLLKAKGISTVEETTDFKWGYYGNASYIPTDKIKNVNGVFSFDKSLFDANGQLKVFCELSNKGYPNMGGSNPVYATLPITLTINLLSIQNDNTSAYSFSVANNKLNIFTTGSSENVTVYSLTGQLLVQGKTNTDGKGFLDISALPHGTYILRIAQKSFKFVR